MTTVSNGQVPAASLPDLPSAESTRRDAPRRAESVPQTPADVTHSDASREVRRAQIAARLGLSGASLLHARPLSLASAWEFHAASASHYSAALLRWPRYAWGAVDTVLKALMYGLGWVSESPARFVVAVAVGLVIWHWH